MRHWSQPEITQTDDLLVECVTFDENNNPEERKVTPLRQALAGWLPFGAPVEKVSADPRGAISQAG